jgi:hypothetical protein
MMYCVRTRQTTNNRNSPRPDSHARRKSGRRGAYSAVKARLEIQVLDMQQFVYVALGELKPFAHRGCAIAVWLDFGQ